MSTILKYMKPYKFYMLWTLCFKFLAALLDLFIPSVLAKIIDDIVPTGNMRMIIVWGGIMIISAIFSAIINITANRMAEVSAGKMTKQIRNDLFTKTAYLSSGQIDTITISSAVSRLTSDTFNVNNMLARIQRLGVRGPILLIGGILITMTMEPKLTLVLVSTLPIILLIVGLVTYKSVPIYGKQQQLLDKMVRVLRENMTGVRVIRALSRIEYEKDRFDGVNEELADVEQHAGRVSAISNPATSLALNLGLTVVIVVGAVLVQKGQSGPGAIIAFLSYFTIILNAMLGITKVFVMCAKGIASARRISELLEMPDTMPVQKTSELETEAETREGKEEAEPEAFHIEFQNVSFSYYQQENNLTNISFALKRGETLGILGATGSGKSTIINLLLRFYDISKGKILINGEDVKTIPYEKLRNNTGVVFQNDYLMAATIEENISYFRDLTREQILVAAEHAQAQEFIDHKDGEMDASVAVRGNNLSGGQKQRIMIARALAGNPEILILDDASSALDYQTEAKLRKALDTNYNKATKIIVAQRISSIRGADHILVLDEGKCVGYGSHNELIENCQTYRAICDLQVGMEKEAAL